SHRLVDEAVKWFNPGTRFAAPGQLCPADIPRRQICQRSPAFVLMFVACHAAGGWRRRAVTARPRLNTRLLVGREDVFIIPQAPALPVALVQIKDHPGLRGELRIAREDPAAMPPRANRIGRQPAPDGRPADLRHQSLPDGFARNLTARESRERQTES